MHLVTLSFDDGLRTSCLRIAEIYERFGLSACFNIVAAGHNTKPCSWDTVTPGAGRGDFELWNELQARGHEIMPHGYRHANKAKLPLPEAQDLILRCLSVFAEELEGFVPERAVFNFPFNASTPELEAWLPTVVRAFRTAGSGINPPPHEGMTKLTCTNLGPGNCEEHLDAQVELLLSGPPAWLIYNGHGLDGEGWGPVRGAYLERLLERLVSMKTVRILPAARALSQLQRVGRRNHPPDR